MKTTKRQKKHGLLHMDSQITIEGRMIDLIDEKWREDKLPMEDVAVPQMELPELEPDNGPTIETLHEQEQKWSDLSLHTFNPLPMSGGDK
ncbi:anaphase-promoting complex subunit 13 isoform X2 [Octopus bimaculoides]|uniref:anaphase-promoting complex subunit 13 isoform X2 n=1 Tax=Octopus bimaculoides TaxID=37653 RepID=UPI00071CA3D7|nr:anaphase-promoting complex subunit 13 isoform X2 [Octopus bimaculoides]|eukprot:XP_014768435.1 PREDICTED: anaphase-promoting complex subunit 13-like isoform X1 [Octopus bimaculoides]